MIWHTTGSGKSFTIVTKSDGKYVDAIEKLIGKQIEWHDGDMSTLVVKEDDSETPRRGRGAPRRAGRKDGDDRRKGKRDDKRAANENTEEQAVADAPAVENDERRARKDAIRTENAGRKEQRPDPRPQRDQRPHRRREEENDATVGFGDDMPAFMKIVAKV